MDSFLTVVFCLSDFLFPNMIKLLYLSVVPGGYCSTGRREFPISCKWKQWRKTAEIRTFLALEQKEVE